MSQKRVMGVELRAIFAVVAACALVFSLLVSGAVTGAGGPALHAGVSLAGASGNASAVIDCHRWRQIASVAGTASRKPSGGQTGHIHCPDCCLVTQAAAAVLPERLATITRPTPASAGRAPYSAFSFHEPNAAISNTVNGARAPPAAFSIS